MLGSASQSLCLYSSNIFDNGRRPGATDPKNALLDALLDPTRNAVFEPWTPQGSIFIDFSTIQSDIEKTMIFRILQNRPKWQNQSTLGRPRSVFGAKTSTFGLPFGIDFSFFSENGAPGNRRL